MLRIFVFTLSLCVLFLSMGVISFAEEIGTSAVSDQIVIESPVIPDEITVDQLTVNAGSVLLAEEVEVYAVDAPSGHWVEVSGAPVDLIYIPANYAENSFYLSNGRLYGMNSATITGYADGYSFRFAPYATPQYRDDDTTYTWRDVNLTLIDSQGVEIEGYNYYFDQKLWLLLAAVGVILFCLFMRR